MLAELLEKYNPAAANPTTAILETVFTELETVRIPASSTSVKASRKMGESRVVEGLEAALQRNKDYTAMWSDEASIRKAYGRG